MAAMNISRRQVLRSVTALAALQAVGCEVFRGGPLFGQGVFAYRRSGRGRCLSNAAKKHNANHLYATRAAAEADMAHPGDKSKVVRIVINRALHRNLFGNGTDAVDLRQVL